MAGPGPPRRRQRGGPPIALGCDLGGSEIKLAALRGGRIVLLERRPTPRGGARDLVSELAGAAAAAAEVLRSRSRTGIDRRAPPLTLGVALPGLLDPRRDRPLHVQNLPALEGFPLRRELERLTGWRAVLEPDSNAGAVGEALLGAGRGAKRVLYLTLGTGVGAALVVDSCPVRVSNHTVGQVAHLPLDPRGPRCPCGARGCLESVLSASGILWRARRAARRGPGLPPGALRSPRSLSEAARGGSRTARRAFEETGRFLGEALAALANLFSPEVVVVGGGISRAGALLLEPARGVLAARLVPRLRGRVALARARLSPFSGAAGAACLARGLAR